MGDWNNYFLSLKKYLDYFRACNQIPAVRGYPNVSGSSQSISKDELTGLLSWTQLATAIAEKDLETRREIYEERNWNCVETVSQLLSCSIPLVLKGNFYKFLAALAIDEAAAIHIWNCILCEGICAQSSDGRLTGVKQDLEEQECVLKVYDCSEGYLKLIKTLFTHKTRPAANQLAPHLTFIIKHIICQFSSRSYNDPQQMWELVKQGLDCLYELLKMFYVNQTAVSNKSSEVQVLVELLNDTPLCRSIFQLIVEGTTESNIENLRDEAREQAAFSAIRLFHMAISHRSSMADSIRAVTSNLLISSLKSIMFTTIHNKPESNILLVLLSYLSEADYFADHAFYVIKILRELSCQRPSLQLQIIESVYPIRKSLVENISRMTSVFSFETEIAFLDLVPLNIEENSMARKRGEILRHLLETLIDSMESDAKHPNIAYLILGFNLKDVANTDFQFINVKEGKATLLHNIVQIVEVLATSDDPFAVPFSGLYESALRLLLKLVSFGALSSNLMLRFLRSHYNLIYKLSVSKAFTRIEPQQRKFNITCDSESATNILRRSIQGIVLELVARELSALIKIGHIEQPKNFIIALLSSTNNNNNNVEQQNPPENNYEEESYYNATHITTTKTAQSPGKAILWCLLEQSRIDIEELVKPICSKFDTNKIDELLKFCTRKNSCNVDQFDIEYLHLLLNTEISSIHNAEIGIIRQEAREILEFCTQHNSRNLLEGSSIHLLSGWLSVVNVLSLYAPLPFLELELHQSFLVDAVFLLKDYCMNVDTSVEISGMLSNCIFRIVRTLCNLLKMRFHELSQMRQNLFPIIHLLLNCLIQPGYSKCVRFKMDIYGSILSIFNTLNECTTKFEVQQQSNNLSQADLSPNGSLQTNGTYANGDGVKSLANLMDEEREKLENWKKIFETITPEIVSTITSDITFAPLSLKIVATSCLSDIIREDIVNSQSVAPYFVSSGAMRCVLDTLSRVVTDFKTDKSNDTAKAQQQILLLKALFSLFVRLAASRCGWSALIEGKALQRLLSFLNDTDGANGEEQQSSVTKPTSNSSSTALFQQLLETIAKL